MNNSITVVGHVGQTPQEHKFSSGAKVAKFSVAVKEFSPNGDDKTLWLDVQAWNGMADRVLAAVTKGRELVVTGRLSVDQYDRKREDGSSEIVTKPIIRLASFHLCGARPKKDESPVEKTKSTKPKSKAS